MEGKHLIPNQEIGRSIWCPMISFEDLPLGHSTSWFWYLCSQTFYTWVSGGHWTPKYVGPCLVLHLLTSTCLCSPPHSRKAIVHCLSPRILCSAWPGQGVICLWSLHVCVKTKAHVCPSYYLSHIALSTNPKQKYTQENHSMMFPHELWNCGHCCVGCLCLSLDFKAQWNPFVIRLLCVWRHWFFSLLRSSKIWFC